MFYVLYIAGPLLVGKRFSDTRALRIYLVSTLAYLRAHALFFRLLLVSASYCMYVVTRSRIEVRGIIFRPSASPAPPRHAL